MRRSAPLRRKRLRHPPDHDDISPHSVAIDCFAVQDESRDGAIVPFAMLSPQKKITDPAGVHQSRSGISSTSNASHNPDHLKRSLQSCGFALSAVTAIVQRKVPCSLKSVS